MDNNTCIDFAAHSGYPGVLCLRRNGVEWARRCQNAATAKNQNAIGMLRIPNSASLKALFSLLLNTPSQSSHLFATAALGNHQGTSSIH
jgi:hypothetical protein